MQHSIKPAIFSILKKPTPFLVMLGFAFIFFDLQFLIMSKLPGSENEMCVMGAGLNLSNILFAIAISLMGGLFVAGFTQTFKKNKASYGTLSLSGIAAVIGTLTVFCTACTIPVLSIFGLAIGISFFTTYNIWFKVISLALMGFGLYQLNKQLKGECDRCVE
jgi:hypothetical protein